MQGSTVLNSPFHRGRLARGQRSLLVTLECSLGIVCIFLAATLAHWAGWLLPVAVLLYLLVIVPVALFCGFWQSVVVSFSAVLVHCYYTVQQPGFTTLAEPATSVTLIVFIATALVVSRLSSRITEHAQEVEAKNRAMEDVYLFTRQTLQLNLHDEPGNQLVALVQEVFDLEAVAVFDADLHRVYKAGYWPNDPMEIAQSTYYFESSDDDLETGLGRRVLRLGTVPIGSLIVRGDSSPLTNNAIASLIAITFDRYRAFANETRIEGERQTEQLRSTVLDSLAHAYKTPLTAIRAASTGLMEMGKLSAAQAELVTLIAEQAEMLNELTTRLLTTARLDAGDMTVHTTPVAVGPMIEEVIESLRDRVASMKIDIDLENEEMVLCCDRELMVALLTQYIDNACKYSLYGTTITIRVEQGAGEMVFGVHGFGPVIPEADRERIFDRYYRSAGSSSRASGTGIGLSVAKRAAHVHEGHVWVTSDEQQGTTFYAAIPTRTPIGCTP